MKKGLMAAFAASLVFAACTNEELVQQIQVPGAEGDMITLGENFALSVTRGEDAATRAQYDGNAKINWLPQVKEVSPGVYEPVINKIGLSWKGQGDGKVYTNYMFENFAFEVFGKDPKVDECVGWQNLVFFTEDDFNTYGNGNDTDNDYVTSWDWETANFKTTVVTKYSKAIDPSVAYFKTENLTLFGGDYVVYMPYDETLIDAGYLHAKSPAVFEGMNVGAQGQSAKILEHVADYHFYATNATMVGGQTANGFDLKAVTGNVILKFINTTKDTDWANISKVAIYGPNGIVIEQALNANTLELTDVIDKSTSLMANLATVTNFDHNAAGNKTHYVAMTALPQTIENATVVLFEKDGLSSAINVGNIKVERNRSTTVEVKLDATNTLQADKYYVVDMETFQLAMTKAAYSGSVNKTAKIQLINDIDFDMAYTTGHDGKVWVNRDMEIFGGDITVPAGQELYLGLIGDEVNVTIGGDIKIEDACCGTSAAIVSVFGYNNNPSADKESTIKFQGTVDIEKGATLTIGTDDTEYVNATFEKDVTNANELTILGDASVSFNRLVNQKTLTLTNTSASTNNNNVVVSTLENGVDATIAVNDQTTLTATTTVNNGSMTIEASGSEADGLDGTVNVESSMTNNGVIENAGVYNSNGSTTLNENSQFVDYVGSQYGNIMPVMKGGDYICEVNTSDKTNGDRLAYALNDKMKTTIVRFVTDETHEYQLNEYDEYAKLAQVDFVINTTDATPVVFKNNLPTAQGQIVLGGDLTVLSAQSVTFNGNDTKIGGNLAVECDAAITNNGLNSAQVTVGGNVTLSKGATLTVQALKGATAANQLTAKSLTVGGDVILTNEANTKLTVENNAAVDVEGGLTIAANASAVFEYSSYSDFGGKIVNNGTFNRVLSSGSSNANPAMVWCTGYTNNGTQVNGAAQVSE